MAVQKKTGHMASGCILTARRVAHDWQHERTPRGRRCVDRARIGAGKARAGRGAAGAGVAPGEQQENGLSPDDGDAPAAEAGPEAGGMTMDFDAELAKLRAELRGRDALDAQLDRGAGLMAAAWQAARRA